MILINSPNNCINERNYIFDYIFKDILDCEVKIIYGDFTNLEIINSDGKKLLFPDIFFKEIENKWLEKYDFKIPLKSIKYNINGEILDVPLIFYLDLEHKDKINFINNDIFGFIFFILTRYEELYSSRLDIHSRFDHNHSIIADYISIPVVDIYIDILRDLLKDYLNISLVLVKNYSIEFSCDLDYVYLYEKNFSKIFKKLIRLIIYKYSKEDIISIVKDLFTKKINISNNSFVKAIDFIIDSAEKYNTRPTFFIIPKITNKTYDIQTLENSIVKSVAYSLIENDYRIGIHPGYDTYNSDEVFFQSVSIFKNIFDVNKLLSRQHYLRWHNPDTLRILEKLNIFCDFSLGYPNKSGFRCGTSKKFYLYDLKNRKKTKVLEQPLIFMDTTFFNSKENNTYKIKEAIQLKNLCKYFGGTFSILMHNYNYNCQENRILINKILRD